MLDATESYKKAMSAPGRILSVKMAFNDREFTEREIKEVKIDDKLLTGESFEIGTFIATSGEATLIDVIDYKFAGKQCSVFIGAENEGGVMEYLKVGIFNCESVTTKERVTTLKLYDNTTRFDKEYISKLTYPCTLLDVLRDVCKSVGVVLKTEVFPNSNYVVELKPNFDEGFTFRRAVAQVAELAGGYARITTDNKLELFNLNEESGTYANPNTYAKHNIDILSKKTCVVGMDNNRYIDLDVAESITEYISSVVVKVGDEKVSYGATGGRTYFIENNIFCQNPYLCIDEIYDSLAGLRYRKLNMKWVGNPIWQCGDKLTVYDGNKFYNTFIMTRKLSFTGGLNEEYGASGKTKEEGQGNYKGNLTMKVDKTIVEVRINAEEISQRVKNEDFESYIKQTAEEISSKVTAKDVETLVKQNADSWELSIKGKLVGKTYRFDSRGFHLGGSDSSNTVSHTNNESIYKHEDGSYTKISSSGLERFVGSTKAKYHSMIYLGEIDVTLEPSQVSGRTFDVTLPADWRGKDFKAFCCVSDFQTANISANNRVGAWIHSYDRTNGKFTIKANAEAWLLTPLSGNAWGIETNFAKAKILISYIVIA